jgi:hypothetical protein
MCTREWQRYDTGAEAAASPMPWTGAVTTLEADGTLSRRFVGCTCGRSLAAAATPDSRHQIGRQREDGRRGRQHRSVPRRPIVMRLQRGASPG